MSRGILILVVLGVFLGLTVVGVAPGWLSFYTVMFGQGMAALLWLAAAGMLGSLLLRYTVGRLPGLLGVITSMAVGLGTVSLLTLGLGLAGWLNAMSGWVMAVGGVVAFVADLLIRRGNPSLEKSRQVLEQWLREKPQNTWPWLAVAVFAAIAVAAATLPPGSLWPGDPVPYDVLEYHLQVPREWYEARRIIPLSHNAYCFFPANLEMHYLLAMHLYGGPWKAMYLAHYLTLGHMAVAVAGVYAILRHLLPKSIAAGAAALATAALVITPWTVSLASVAYNEAALLMYGTLAIGWAIVALDDLRPVRCMAVGGLLAGLACGAKYTAVPMVLLPVPVVVAAVMMVRAKVQTPHPNPLPGVPGRGDKTWALSIDWEQLIWAVGMWLVCGVVAFAPWLGRNRIWTGNAVFPEAMSLLGPGAFTPTQVHRWEVAHSPTAAERSLGGRLKAGANRIILDGRYGYLIWPLAIAGLVVGRRDRWVWLAGGLLVLMAIFWLGFTHLQSRFFVLGLPLAGLLIGRAAVGAMGRWVVGAALVPLAIFSMFGSPASWQSPPTKDSWKGLCRIAYPQLNLFAKGDLFGLENLSVYLTAYLPDEITQKVKDGAPLALVGDAQAFLYTTPPGRLSYRTVFDINPPSGDATALDAWLGPQATRLRTDHYVIIFPEDLQRLHGTYADVPLPPQAKWVQRPILLLPTRQ